ncbi:MAG: peptidyl-tRNA hydrolase, partial [Desulfobacteraceae bacterium]
MIETLAQNHQIPLNQKKFQSIFGQGIIAGHKVHLILPQTYMNLSGVSVGTWIRYFHSSPERLLVVHDDLDLAWGRIRIVAKGGAGGHRGVLSLIEHLANQRFYPACEWAWDAPPGISRRKRMYWKQSQQAGVQNWINWWRRPARP